LTGQEEAPGTAGGAGVVTQGSFEILVRAKPFDVPSEIVVDCSILDTIDAAILANEVKFPTGVELAGPEDERIAWVQPPRVTAEEDLAPVVEGEEGEILEDAEGEEAVEGEEDTSSDAEPEES
jgi:large subunit ribosomal protein L25